MPVVNILWAATIAVAAAGAAACAALVVVVVVVGFVVCSLVFFLYLLLVHCIWCEYGVCYTRDIKFFNAISQTILGQCRIKFGT